MSWLLVIVDASDTIVSIDIIVVSILLKLF